MWGAGPSSLNVVTPNNMLMGGFGTSFAAPIVSSMAANAWQAVDAHPDLTATPALIKALMIHAGLKHVSHKLKLRCSLAFRAAARPIKRKAKVSFGSNQPLFATGGSRPEDALRGVFKTRGHLCRRLMIYSGQDIHLHKRLAHSLGKLCANFAILRASACSL